MTLNSTENWKTNSEKPKTRREELVLDTTRQLQDSLVNVRIEKSITFSIQEVMQISTILNSTLSLQEIKELVTESLRGLFDAEGCSIYLWNSDTESLEFDVVKWKGLEEMKTIQLKKWEGIAGRVAEDPQIRIIDDAQNHRKFHGEWDKISWRTTRNMMCAPIESRGNLVWVLQVINKKNNWHFLPEELDLLMGTANNLGMAISNAKAYELEQEKNKELEEKNKELKDIMTKNILTLADSIWTRDSYTGVHTERVMHYTDFIAQKLNFSEEQRETLKNAARLHDIGKIWIPDEILLKKWKLTDEEYEKIKEHSEISEKMLSHMENADLLKKTIRWHHERWDGKWYPDGLEWEEISFCSRIISVVDAFDAMTTNRPYRWTLPQEVAIAELIRNKWTQFDPKIVDIFLWILDNFDVEEFKDVVDKKREWRLDEII